MKNSPYKKWKKIDELEWKKILGDNTFVLKPGETLFNLMDWERIAWVYIATNIRWDYSFIVKWDIKKIDTYKQDIRKDIKKIDTNIKNVVIINNNSILQIQYSGIQKNKYTEFKENIILNLAKKDWLKYFTKVEFLDVTI